MAKESRFLQSVETLLLGMLLGVIAFVILGYTDGLFHDMNLIRWLPLIEVEDVKIADGMAKITGEPMLDDDHIYYKQVFEEKIRDEWKVVKVQETWNSFSLNGILIKPQGSIGYFDLEEVEKTEQGDIRYTAYKVSAYDDMIIVGDLQNEVVEGGEVFFITNKSDDVIERELRDMIHNDWWVYRLVAWFLLTLGTIALLTPLLSFLEVFSELGPLSSVILIFGSLAIGFLIVTIETLVFAFWYLILIVIFLIGYLFFRVYCCKKKRNPINILPN
ncbi:TMEM43 family protein [Patescibacteria group bacterium]